MSETGQRIDKWLFFARLLKTRTLAQKFALSGAVRVNREKIAHAARMVRPGDVLTLQLHERVRVLKVLAVGERRGPAPEAALLYEDLSEPVAAKVPEAGVPQAAAGRPSGRDRRAARALKGGGWDE